MPDPSRGEALVKVKAASINPGEAKIREGLMHAMWPATFPSGEGSDLAGIVTKLGLGVDSFAVGAEVIGFTDQRASHAEYVLVEAQNLTIKPAKVSWEVAGSLAVAGSTAYASVRAVSLKKGDTVALSGAAGGVGSIAVQLATRTGAEVIGIASPANHQWLAAHRVKPESYGADLADRLRKTKIDAFIDTHGGGYVKLAVELGVPRDRIQTIIDFAAVREYGVKSEGSNAARNASVLEELAALVASGDLEVPIAATFPLDQVRAAFSLLGHGHVRGKIVLLP
jgi:NADPH:quinone reductase-like Zn-dependent oxidoreductase